MSRDEWARWMALIVLTGYATALIAALVALAVAWVRDWWDV